MDTPNEPTQPSYGAGSRPERPAEFGAPVVHENTATASPWAPPPLDPPQSSQQPGSTQPFADPSSADTVRFADRSLERQSPRRGWTRRIGLVVAGALLAVGGGVVGALAAERFDDDGGNTAATEILTGEGVNVAPAGDASGAIDVLSVAEQVAPSVVTISADVDSATGEGTSVGTGVIISSDGEVLTNAHVVEGATEIRVRLNGEIEPVTAELVAADGSNDLALLRLQGTDYTPATFADPGSTEIGDQVVAIGFALDLDGDPSVTLGIVSALNRTLNMGDNEILDGLIQTDAAISSGNSGGPLVNARGEVVGINTAVARGDVFTAATNVGFAISVGEVLKVLEQLRDTDGTERADGYLGVELTQRIDGGQGALITSVQPDTPAAAAGVEANDVVIAVDDVAVDGADGLIAAIRDREPGDLIELTVIRDGEPLVIAITLTERPDNL